MPRIENRLLKAVIYLYTDEEAAEQGKPGGSGFVVGEPSSLTGVVALFAVTNVHVASLCPVIRTAGDEHGRTIPGVWDDWKPHPENDDIAVRLIGFVPEDARNQPFDFIPREWFVLPEHFTDAHVDEDRQIPRVWPFGPGDEVVMLGRFLGHDGGSSNAPSARFGHLAIGSPVAIDHPLGHTQSSFLIECRSVTGFSGSPVFMFREMDTLGAGPIPIGSETHGTSGLPRLLGVDWGNLDRVASTTYSVDWSSGPDRTLGNWSGMLVAVPAWRLASLLDSPEVSRLKKDAEDELRERTKGVNLDFLNPDGTEFDRFAELTGKLVQVPKDEITRQPDDQ